MCAKTRPTPPFLRKSYLYAAYTMRLQTHTHTYGLMLLLFYSLNNPVTFQLHYLCIKLSIFSHKQLFLSSFSSPTPLFTRKAAHDSDSRYLSAEEQSRELTRSIRREVGKLSEQWNNLIDRSDNWKHRLDEYMTVSLQY